MTGYYVIIFLVQSHDTLYSVVQFIEIIGLGCGLYCLTTCFVSNVCGVKMVA